MRINYFVYPMLVLVVTWFISTTGGKPIQVLQNKQGWIPVYIRYDNEPLENINLSLAEAFHEASSNVNAVQPIENHNDTSIINEDTIDDDSSSQNNPFVSAN